MDYQEYDYEDFMERLDLKRMGIIPDYRPFAPSRYPALLKLYDQFDQETKILFNHLFKQPTKTTKKPIIQQMDDDQQYYDYSDYYKKVGNQQFQKIKFEDIIPIEFTKTDMPTCNQVFQKGEHAYKCYDCQKVSVCIWCVICFEESEHRGHRYTLIPVQGGGTCDCGNIQSMSPSGFCRKHKGKYSEPMIDQKERSQFSKYIGNIWHWITLMYQVEHLNSIVVLIHFCIYLDKLNNHSLIYNVLTQQLLKKGEPMMIDCLFEWGSKHYDTLLSKYANEMLLKMFSIPSVKDLLAQKFIFHYNRDYRFQTSDFKYLFLQLFINNELVQRVIPRIKQSLCPRDRDYDTNEYNRLLKNAQSFSKKSAKIFFNPIINSGGIDQGLLRYIDETIEKSTYNMDFIYKEQKYCKYDNTYYEVMSILCNIYQDQPQMLQKQIVNQVKLSKKYIYKKNKVVIPHHRSFCLLVFAYFNCNLQQINSEKVRNILGFGKKQFIGFIVQYLRFYLKSMKEFALTFANRDDSKYEFDAYIGLYVSNPLLSQVFLYDILGLKVLSMLLFKQNQQQEFGTALELVFKQEREKIDQDQHWLRRDIQNTRRQINQERQMMKRHYKGRNMPPDMMEDMEMQRYMRHGYGGSFGRGNKNQSAGQFIRQCEEKLAISAKTHFLEWVHFMHLLIQATLTERSEVIIAGRCGINNVKIQQINQRQMIGLFKNVKSLTVQELEALYPFWFGKQINKELLLKIATFDKTKKKYTVKENIEGNPIFKDLFHSFLGNDTYLKYTSKPIELTNIHKCLKSTILSEKIMGVFTQRLFQNFRTKNFPRTAQQIRYFAGLIKLIGFVFGTETEQSKQMKKRMLEIAQNFNIVSQISLIFDQQAEIIPKQKSEAEKKRLEQLKKKQKEKFNNLKKNATENNKKILENQIEKLDLQITSTEQCYICKGKGDLFYLGLYGQSSFMFNTLQLNGTYPYFHSCFHTIHFGCYLQLCKDSDKIACPLCKSVSNILLPSQISLQKNPAILNFMNERLEIISTIESKNKQVQNLNLHLSKCFVHLFFLNLLQKRPLQQKKIRLYKMILQFLSKRYQQLNQVEKQKYEHHLNSVHQIYKSEMKTSYPVDQLIKLVNQFTLKTIKKQAIDTNYLNNLLKTIDHLPQADIIKILNFSVQIYGLNKNIKPDIKKKQVSDPLSQRINFYRPPKTVKELLKVRGSEEGKCKFGHNAVICIICNWKGCGDCPESIQHCTEKHCKRSIFFNFITGGIIYIANTKRFKIDCIYISQISGRPWLAKQKEDDYVLDVQLYDQLLQSLVYENLMQFMTSQLKDVEVPDLF